MLTILAALTSVTLAPGVVTIPHLLKELSTKSGINLRYTDETKNDVLYVKLTQRDPQKVLDLVAKADAAEWTQNGDAKVLTRTPKLIATQERADHQLLIADLQNDFRVLTEGIDLNPWTRSTVEKSIIEIGVAARRTKGSNSWIDFNRQSFQNAMWRLLGRTLKRTGFKDFAIPLGERRVFSTNPTHHQFSLQLSLADLSTYETESRVLSQYISSRKPRKWPEGFPEYLKTPGIGVKWPACEFRIDATHESLRGVELRAAVFDQNINEIESCTLRLGDDAGLSAATPFNLDESKRYPVKIGKVAQGFINWNKPSAVTNSAILALKPAEHEPTELVLGDVLNQLTDTGLGDWVFAIPDEAATGICDQLDSSPDLRNVRWRLSQSVSFSQVSGTNVGQPLRAGVSRALRTDRHKLQRLIGELSTTPILSLQTMADYALSVSELSGLSRFELMVVHGAGFSSAEIVFLDYLQARRRLRIYALLGPAQRKALWAHQNINFSDLSIPAKASYARYVYGIDRAVEQSGSIDRDATLSWEDGIPIDSVLSATFRESPMLRVSDQNTAWDVSPDYLGDRIARQELGAVPDLENGEFDVKKQKHRPLVKVDIEIVLTSNSGNTSLPFEDAKDVSPASVPYQNLPASYQKLIKESSDGTRKQIQSATPDRRIVPPTTSRLPHNEPPTATPRPIPRGNSC